jgi:hypothetical protein
MEKIKGWKTIGFNVITLLLLLLQQSETFVLIPNLEQYVGYILTIGNFILRFMTTTPAMKSS